MITHCTMVFKFYVLSIKGVIHCWQDGLNKLGSICSRKNKYFFFNCAKCKLLQCCCWQLIGSIWVQVTGKDYTLFIYYQHFNSANQTCPLRDALKTLYLILLIYCIQGTFVDQNCFFLHLHKLLSVPCILYRIKSASKGGKNTITKSSVLSVTIRFLKRKSQIISPVN